MSNENELKPMVFLHLNFIANKMKKNNNLIIVSVRFIAYNRSHVAINGTLAPHIWTHSTFNLIRDGALYLGISNET